MLTDSCGDQVGSAVLRANAAACLDELGEHSLAIELYLQALAAREGRHDEPIRMDLLGGAARALARDGQAERACALWEEVLLLARRLGDTENAAATLRLLAQPATSHRTMFARRVSARPTTRLLSREQSFSLSEYTLAPASAPLFRIGELLAALHERGFRYGQLRPGHIELMADATVAIARTPSFEPNQPLDPERMAADFWSPFATYPWEDFRAILAGYARSSYERIVIPHLLASFGFDLVGMGPAPLVPALVWTGVAPPPWQGRLGSPADACQRPSKYELSKR